MLMAGYFTPPPSPEPDYGAMLTSVDYKIKLLLMKGTGLNAEVRELIDELLDQRLSYMRRAGQR